MLLCVQMWVAGVASGNFPFKEAVCYPTVLSVLTKMVHSDLPLVMEQMNMIIHHEDHDYDCGWATLFDAIITG